MNDINLETINLIIGGSIAIISALLTSIANYIFQSFDSRRKRKWQLEDITRDKKEKILLNRIDVAEKFVMDIIACISSLISQIEYFLDDNITVTEYYNKLSPIINSVNSSAMIKTINDEEFDKYFDVFTEDVSNLMSNTYSVIKQYKSGEIDRAKAGENILGILGTPSESFHKIIKRLEELRIQVISKQ